MIETILFCFAFLSQVLLISWFFARRIIGNRRYVLRNFPPATHPKLYPQPLDYYERRLRIFTRLNLAIVIAGLLIVVGLMLAALVDERDWGILSSSRDQHWDAAIVTPFFIVQTFAIMYLDFSLKHHKAMATAPPPRVRTTELQRRRLTDFVSPTLLVVAGLTNVAFIVFVLYYRRFGFPWFTAAGNIAGVAAMLVLFTALVGVTLHARRPDPYQAQQDRRNSIKLIVQQALIVSIATPVLIAINLIIKYFDTDLLEPVIASLYCQGMALALFWPIFSYRIDNVDFDVYKRDDRDSTPDVSARTS